MCDSRPRIPRTPQMVLLVLPRTVKKKRDEYEETIS
jgi:hypothetical protein